MVWVQDARGYAVGGKLNQPGLTTDARHVASSLCGPFSPPLETREAWRMPWRPLFPCRNVNKNTPHTYTHRELSFRGRCKCDTAKGTRAPDAVPTRTGTRGWVVFLGGKHDNDPLVSEHFLLPRLVVCRSAGLHRGAPFEPASLPSAQSNS